MLPNLLKRPRRRHYWLTLLPGLLPAGAWIAFAIFHYPQRGTPASYCAPGAGNNHKEGGHLPTGCASTDILVGQKARDTGRLSGSTLSIGGKTARRAIESHPANVLVSQVYTTMVYDAAGTPLFGFTTQIGPATDKATLRRDYSHPRHFGGFDHKGGGETLNAGIPDIATPVNPETPQAYLLAHFGGNGCAGHLDRHPGDGSRPYERGGLGDTSGWITTLFVEPITYQMSGNYYDQDNQLSSVSYTPHHGVDISGGCVAGSYPVYAAASGTVAFAQYIGDGYGSQVAVDNGYNVGSNGRYTYTFYSHMGNRTTGARYIVVSPGQHVEAGDVIGYQGNDGSTFGSCNPDPGTHLDWEVRVSDTALTYGTQMRYSAVAASQDFYTFQPLTYDDPNPLCQGHGRAIRRRWKCDQHTHSSILQRTRLSRSRHGHRVASWYALQ